MKLQRTLILLVACTAIQSMTQPVRAATYTITDLGDLAGGMGTSQALDINNVGQVVGKSGAASNDRPFLWDAINGMQDLGVLPGFNVGEATAINHVGEVAGQIAGPPTHAFKWDSVNGMQDLGELARQPFGGYYATDINDFGQVVGTADLEDEFTPFLWDNVNGMRELVGPSFDSFANGLNNLGQIVGDSLTRRFRPFLWDAANGSQFLGDDPGFGAGGFAHDINDRGQVAGSFNGRATLWDQANPMRDLGDPSASDEHEALGINELGQVVGWWDRSGGDDREELTAFVWDLRNGMQDLEVLSNAAIQGWQFQHAEAINDLGQIVGWGLNPAGHEHAFLLTPVPEPSSVLLIVGACSAVALGDRITRRRERLVPLPIC